MKWRVVVILAVLCLLALVPEGQAKKKKKNRPPKRRMSTIVKDLEKNVSALWEEVEELSQPVHVHIHGDGRVMNDFGEGHDDYDEDHEGGHHEHHGETRHPHAPQDDDSDHGKYPGKKHGKGHHGMDKDGMEAKKKHGHSKHTSHSKPHPDNMRAPGILPGEPHPDNMRGHGRGYGHEEDEHDGTHVHIHLHTAMAAAQGLGMRPPMEPMGHEEPPLPGYRYALCQMKGNTALSYADRQDISGSIYFRQKVPGPLEARMNLKGFRVSHLEESDHRHLRGMHGHEYGDMSDGCNRQGSHFNPHGSHHGGPHDSTRHPGDFGNILVSDSGTVVTSFNDTRASLFGPDSLLGRGIVIHAGADDLGKGGSEASKKSGNAGQRIACCAVLAAGEPEGVWDKDASEANDDDIFGNFGW